MAGPILLDGVSARLSPSADYMKSKRAHEGYLVIDHRASPGTQAVPEGQVYETPTVTCSHCGAVVILSPTRTRPRHYCYKCDHYVCDKPQCVLECVPWMKILDTVDAIAHHASGPIIVPEQPNRIVDDKKLIVVGGEEQEEKDG